MSVIVSQRNRAVSQAAVDAVTTARRFTYTNLFALPGNHNILNGTFVPFGENTDSGWWGSELSDDNGYLPNPATLAVTERTSAYLFSLRGIQNNYPVDFTLTLYLNGIVQDTVSITNNENSSVDITLDKAYDIDKYELTITRISVGNDVLKIATASFGLNVSNLMKASERRIHGRVEVTYANAIKDTAITINSGAHGSSGGNLTNQSVLQSANFFKLYDNKLDGSYVVAGADSEVGWWPKGMPDGTSYDSGATLSVSFSQRNLYGFSLSFDTLDYLSAFSVHFIGASNSTIRVLDVENNTSSKYEISDVIEDVIGIEIQFITTSRPNRPAILLELGIVSSITYEDRDLINLSLLEELSYEDSLEKLGGVSANELTVNFSNEDRSFYFNNPESRIAGYIKKNRKVRAWLGVDMPDSDSTIWSPIGTFWTYSWDVPVGSLVAKMTAFDTIGLLGTQTYYNHQVYRNMSIGALVDTVLTSAKSSFNFLQWRVDAELYDIIIPVAWFEYASYAAALNRIASCDLVNIYCARDGSIVASKRLSGVQSPDDVWSDATNIVSKNYPTLYTTPANYLDVYVTDVVSTEQEVLNVENTGYTVNAGEVRSFTFSGPVENISNIGVDATATYEYVVYSWGIRITFTSAGTFNGIIADGAMLEVSSVTSVHLQDSTSVEENGIVPCEIRSDFIQTTEHANRIAHYLYDRIVDSIYDVEVDYRGDIALTLNNKISLPEGIAPNNLYFIKRHELHWNGALNGSARLNT